jgi:hypothetical protein
MFDINREIERLERCASECELIAAWPRSADPLRK